MSSKSGSKTMVPESRDALNNMKFEVARDLGINLTKGDNGSLSARENGYVGGEMVKRMVESYEHAKSGK